MEENVLQSSQIEEMKSSYTESEKQLRKKIEKLKTNQKEQSSLLQAQKQEIHSTNSTLTKTIKEIQTIRENPTELAQEAVDNKVKEILKQKDIETHWQHELD